MDVDLIIENLQLFFLIFARVFALIQIAPLLSSSIIPGVAKIALALFTAVALLPWVVVEGYPIPDTGLEYAFLMIGEVAVGVSMGLILVVLYTAFQTSGQFFSTQMGFGATQVYDPMAQIQIPIMGQFINLAAMYIFISVGGFQQIFITGVYKSFKTIRPWDLVAAKEGLISILLNDMSALFKYSFIIALPVVGTLLLASITMGLLAKASPQMNLLMLGFPIYIIVAFVVLYASLPVIFQVFVQIVNLSFQKVLELLSLVAGKGVPSWN